MLGTVVFGHNPHTPLLQSLRKAPDHKLCIWHLGEHAGCFPKNSCAQHKMLAAVVFGDTQHIPLLHPLGRADLLRRHVLCPVCLKLCPVCMRLHPLRLRLHLLYFILGVKKGEGDWQGVVLIVLFYFNILYFCPSLFYSTIF